MLLDIVINGAEVCSAIGLDLATTARELAAGSTAFELTPLCGTDGEPIRAARLSALPAGWSAARRMKALSAAALGSLSVAIKRAGIRRLPLFLGLPLQLRSERDGQEILRTLASGCPDTELSVSKDRVFHEGRAAGLIALHHAAVSLMRGEIEHALVGAVDSMCDSNALVELSLDQALRGSENIDGRLTGEGAAFLWLSRIRKLAAGSDNTPASLIATSIAAESALFGGAEPNLGRGLSAAMFDLRTQPVLNGTRVQRVLSCQPDQNFWSNELTQAYLRNTVLFPSAFAVRRLSAQLADTGAASGLIAVALGTYAIEDEDVGNTTLVYAGSDHGPRAACVVTASAAQESPRIDEPLLAGRSPAVVREWIRSRDREHLEELGVLLQARHDELRERGCGWHEVTQLEARVVGHYGASELTSRRMGAAGALDALASDDSETRLGGTLVLVGGDRPDDVQQAAERLVDLVPEQVPVWVDAFTWHGPGGGCLVDGLCALLEQTDTALVCFAASALQRLSICPTARIIARLERTQPGSPEHTALMRLLGRYGMLSAERLSHLPTDPFDPALIEVALWSSAHEPLDNLRIALQRDVDVPPASLVLLASTGLARDAMLIEGWSNARQETRSEASAALARIGQARSISTLLRWMSEAPTGAPLLGDVARALEHMTAAHIVEATEDETEPDSISQTLSRDPDSWLAWWKANQSRFHGAQHYRRGRVHDAHAEVAEILNPSRTLQERDAGLLELLVRRGVRVPVDPNWTVARQVRALRPWTTTASRGASL